LHVGDGKGLSISDIGHTKLYNPHRLFTLSNVLHVPAITKPLLSVKKFCLDNNVYFEFHPFLFYVKDLNTNEVLLSGQSKDGLYTLSRFRSSVPSIPQAYWSPCISASADLWHRCLGHPTSHIFQFLVLKNKIICNNKRLNFQCQSCPLGKSSCLSLKPTGHKTSALLELIFSDVWGPAPLFSSDGYRYFVIFVDAHTKYIWYYPLVAKSDVYSVFHQFQTLVERQFSLKIKCVQTEWGGEYRKLSTFFQTIGIHHRLICPHTHEQNGTVERRHRHIVETGLTLLGQCKAPFCFWNYAFDTSVYLINHMHTLVLDKQSPFDCLFQGSPDYHFLHTFGCLCFPFLRPYNNHKLDFRSSPCVFFGYNSSHLGYRCFDIESHRMYISRHVRFHKHVFLFDKSEQIAQVSTQTHTPSPITILPNLTHSPLFTTQTTPHSVSASALPSLPTQTSQPPPFPCCSPHASLSHHTAAGTCCSSVFPALITRFNSFTDGITDGNAPSVNLSSVICFPSVNSLVIKK
jgi:histone deacetylase 1/2